MLPILGGGGIGGKLVNHLCYADHICLISLSSVSSVCEKLQATRAKVAPVNIIYGSHFSATEATYKVSQNMGNFVEFTRTFTRITHKPVPV